MHEVYLLYCTISTPNLNGFVTSSQKPNPGFISRGAFVLSNRHNSAAACDVRTARPNAYKSSSDTRPSEFRAWMNTSPPATAPTYGTVHFQISQFKLTVQVVQARPLIRGSILLRLIREFLPRQTPGRRPDIINPHYHATVENQSICGPPCLEESPISKRTVRSYLPLKAWSSFVISVDRCSFSDVTVWRRDRCNVSSSRHALYSRC